ncbi:MAG: dTDP-4-dehydrorhamnose 3,5-epimerase [Candidatus Eremiobacteraeota bacterium]|nr:dTDP-4-dehydrorhamnose 3,5-epimerase [Candidatus Eremiobacteraeota bacterium]MBV8355222.1 dTDP-4-dehydrorhamnose 3,5-epimerase [Candidatus Eremiobacteraeota bacterium]
MIEKIATKFAEAWLLVPEVFEDSRGYFKETYSRNKYAELGIGDVFVQDNISRSHNHVIRGMHYDLRLAKLVQCLAGRIFDVIVDVREDSPTYLQWDGHELSESNHRQLYVPAGFAHGFLSLSGWAIVSYKQSEHYDPAQERGIPWNDPAVGIEWPLLGDPFLSEKDRAWQRVKDGQ